MYFGGRTQSRANIWDVSFLARSVVRTVLQHKDWRKALRTTYTVTDSHGVPVPETPIRLLIRIYPELAGLVFDQVRQDELGLARIMDEKVESFFRMGSA